MICEDCGETNKPGTEFCMFCGAYLGWQDQPNPPGANEVTQPLQATQAAPTQASAAPVQATPQRAANPPSPAPTSQSAAPRPAVQQAAATAQAGGQAAGPTTVQEPVAAPVAAAAPVVTACPTCGRTVEPGRRFCAHCGHQLVLPGQAGTPAARQPVTKDTWWSRLWNRKDRVARRSFRRSLPPLYRWRRVIIIVLSLGLIGGGLTLLHYSPKRFVAARYYDIKKTVVLVTPVNARTIPAGASTGGTDPSALVDNTKGAWLTTWTDQTKGSPCNSPQTTPVIELYFDPVRVRRVDVWPGLAADNPNRLLQYRPKDIWIAYGDTCVDSTIQNVETQQIELDTKVPVGSIRIGLVSAWPPDQTPAQDVLGFSEIRLMSRPRT